MQLYGKDCLSNKLLEGVGSIKAINAVSSDESILKLKKLLVRRSGGVDANKDSSPLGGEESQSLDLLHEGFLISLELKFHIDFAVMNLILLPEVILIDQCNCILILVGKLTLPRILFFLLHQVYTKYYSSISTHQVVKVLPCCYAHVICAFSH